MEEISQRSSVIKEVRLAEEGCVWKKAAFHAGYTYHALITREDKVPIPQSDQCSSMINLNVYFCVIYIRKQ